MAGTILKGSLVLALAAVVFGSGFFFGYRFAGDTPMVTLTDASLPGLGTFTARVLFYRDRYAGLWWGTDSSGHQLGRLVREP